MFKWFFIAFFLEQIPIQLSLQSVYPDFMVLLLCYYFVYVQNRYKILKAWGIGLCLDMIHQLSLGIHALALLCIAYVLIDRAKQIQVYPLWQQSLFIAMVLIFYKLLLFNLYYFIDNIFLPWQYFLNIISMILLWPIMVVFFHKDESLLVSR